VENLPKDLEITKCPKNIPKGFKITKCPKILSKGCKIFLMDMKYT
jgi:hypothetical protein